MHPGRIQSRSLKSTFAYWATSATISLGKVFRVSNQCRQKFTAYRSEPAASRTEALTRHPARHGPIPWFPPPTRGLYFEPALFGKSRSQKGCGGRHRRQPLCTHKTSSQHTSSGFADDGGTATAWQDLEGARGPGELAALVISASGPNNQQPSHCPAPTRAGQCEGPER